MTIREGKALKFLYVPDSYAGGIQEGDETPVFIDGVDPAGSAAAVAADLATHEGLTGTAVHGLGSASTLTAGATGEDLVTAADVDAARDVLGLAAVALPPRIVDHANLSFSSALSAGGGNGSTANGYHVIQSSSTANSQIQRRPNENTTLLNLAADGVFADWSGKIEFSMKLGVFVSNPEGVFRAFFGKQTGDAFGLVASGNYVGLTFENRSLVELHVCAAGILTNITASTSADNPHCYISSNNGNVAFYANGALVGQSVLGPSVVSFGTVVFELNNGATAANYGVRCWSQSYGY